MKTLIVTLSFFFVALSASWAQIETPITEETKSNSKGSFNALVMELPGTSTKEVNKTWSKYMKQFKGKTKYDRKLNEYMTDDATIKDMSDNTVDVIAKIDASGEGSVISVWFNLGVSYLSSNDHPERYPSAEKIVKGFANLVSSDMIEAELKDAEKRLKELEDLLKKQEKEEAQRKKDIESYKATIVKMEESIKTAEGDIEQSGKDQENSKISIEEQQKIIEDIKKRLESVK